MTYTLSDIRHLTQVEVVSIDHEQLGVLLARMGIREGSKLVLHSIAPLGDPVAVISGGLTIALRKEDAARITVQPVE